MPLSVRLITHLQRDSASVASVFTKRAFISSVSASSAQEKRQVSRVESSSASAVGADRSSMAGLPSSFGADVTDRIMRFAVGYPRDRLRDIASTISRRDGAHQYIKHPWMRSVLWRVDSAQLAKNLPRFTNWIGPLHGNCVLVASFDTRPQPQLKDLDHRRYHPYAHCDCEYDDLENSTSFRTQLLYSTCDACEPVELQLQRSGF